MMTGITVEVRDEVLRGVREEYQHQQKEMMTRSTRPVSTLKNQVHEIQK